MQTMTTSWDDPANARTVDATVKYEINQNGIAITDICPILVVIRDEDGSDRRVKVHTAAGRRHLVKKMDLTKIESEIAAKHETLV